MAGSTSLNISLNELCKAGPPEFYYDELMGFEVTWVAGHFMVMATVEYGLSEQVIQENIHMSLVGEDTF